MISGHLDDSRRHRRSRAARCHRSVDPTRPASTPACSRAAASRVAHGRRASCASFDALARRVARARADALRARRRDDRGRRRDARSTSTRSSRQLPHRYPAVLVDRVLECVAGQASARLKNVTINEPYFQGHFPDYPVMPGVLVLEALTQLSGVLAVASGMATADGAPALRSTASRPAGSSARSFPATSSCSSRSGSRATPARAVRRARDASTTSVAAESDAARAR